MNGRAVFWFSRHGRALREASPASSFIPHEMPFAGSNFYTCLSRKEIRHITENLLIYYYYAGKKGKPVNFDRQGKQKMTNLELVAQIGAESVELANMYYKGHLSVRELDNMLGKRRTELILRYGEGRRMKAGELERV